MFQRFIEMDLEIHVLLWETFITASLFSQKNYGLFPSLYNDQSTKITIIKTEHLKSNDKLPEYTDDSLSSQMPRLCFSLIFFHSAFDKVHEHSHVVLHIAQYKFNQYRFNLILQKWLSRINLDCNDCKLHDYEKQETKQKLQLWLCWNCPFLNHSISLDAEGPLNPASEENWYTNVFNDQVSNGNVTLLTPKKLITGL